MTRVLQRAFKVQSLCWALLASAAFASWSAAQSRVTSGAECDSVVPHSQRATALQREIDLHPTVASWDALGSLYAQAQSPRCAEFAFRAALRLDPQSSEARYNLALALRLEGKLDEATRELKTLLQAHPDFAPAHLGLGEINADERNNDEAAHNFESAVRLDDHLVTAWEDLVQVNIVRGRAQAAAYWAMRALALKPAAADDYRLRLNLGIAQGQARDYNSAEKTLRELTEAFPEKADPYINLGIIEVHQEHYRTAADDFRRALNLEDRTKVRLELAQADLLATLPREALDMALEYNKRLPRDAEGLSTLGRAYEALNDYPQAIAAYRRSLEVRPADYDALFGLGTCLLRIEDRSAALTSFMAAERVDSSNAAVHYQIYRLLAKEKSEDDQHKSQAEMAEFLRLKREKDESEKTQVMGSAANASLEQGDPAKAAELYRKVLETKPNDAGNHFNLSLALARLNDVDGEMRELRAAMALDPGMARAHNRLGLCEEKLGQLDDAVKEFQAAFEYDPSSADIKINLATGYGKGGQLGKSEGLLREVTGEHPDSLAAQIDLGLVLSSEKKWDEALVPLQVAARLDPENAQPLTLMGIIYGKMGRSEESIDFLRKALRLSPNSANAHMNLGIALADGFNLQEAGEQFAAAETLAPNSAMAHYNAGRVAFDQGDQAKARGELEQACALQNDHTGALQLLALVEIHDNELDAAINHLRRVSALQPHNPDAAYLLGRALADNGRRKDAIAEWQRALEQRPNDTRLLWALAHELPVSDPHRSEYLSTLKQVQGSGRSTDVAKTLANLGMVAAANHEWMEAVEKLSQAIQACQHCSIEASLEQNLGLIYAQHGQLSQAEQALRRSIQIDPDIPRGNEELAIVERLQAHPPAH